MSDLNFEALKPGTYCCVDTRGFVDGGIRLFTRSPYSHSFVVVDGGLIIEAESSGARISKLSKYVGVSHIVANDQEPLTDAQRTAICDKAYQLVGTPYGFLDLVGIGIGCWTGHYPGWLLEDVEEEKRLICSQLVATCYVAAGITLFPKNPSVHPAEVTPGMLALRIDDRPWEGVITVG